MERMNVNPTRMMLTSLKRRLKTAVRGHKLLKDKRDELMKEFLDLARENGRLREEVERDLDGVYKNFTVASSIMSREVMQESLMFPKQGVDLTVGSKNIMSVDVPVFANGDINSVENAIDCIEQSGADGVAIGRGVLGDPTLISRIDHYFNTGEILPAPTLKEKLEIMKNHLAQEVEIKGERVAVKFFRKFYPYYISGVQNASKYRGVLVKEDNYKTLQEYFEQIERELV